MFRRTIIFIALKKRPFTILRYTKWISCKICFWIIKYNLTNPHTSVLATKPTTKSSMSYAVNTSFFWSIITVFKLTLTIRPLNNPISTEGRGAYNKIIVSICKIPLCPVLEETPNV